MAGWETGKISFFGGPGDSQGTASGIPTAVPGISLYRRSTLGGWWLVKMPNGRQAVLQQTDIGPAPWTGRLFDFTNGSLAGLGYSPGNFPTDATASAMYLGKSVPPQYRNLILAKGGQATNTPLGAARAQAGDTSSAGADLFGPAHQHELRNAAITIGVLAAALFLVWTGLNLATHDGPKRALHKTAHATADVAAAVPK